MKDEQKRTIEQQLMAGQVSSTFLLTSLDVRRDDNAGLFIVDVEGTRTIYFAGAPSRKQPVKVRDRLVIAKPQGIPTSIENPYGLKILKIIPIPIT